jgi:NitT/TauT family transport system permease protein
MMRMGTTSFWRGAAGVVVLMALWEAFARSGLFNPAITPPLMRIAGSFWHMLANGTLPLNAGYTLTRVLTGLGIACVLGVPIGMLMGRMRIMERFFLPLVSVLMPIPSLAWVPLFVLWFGISEWTTILVVTYAATFPVLYNVWTGVRAVNPVWTRAALSMGVTRRGLFRKVVLPGALPYVITGIRLAFGRGWIAVIGAELLANPLYGLGKVIFDAKEFLNSEVMIASLVAIGIIGLFFERVVFQTLETVTVARWGMVTAVRK